MDSGFKSKLDQLIAASGGRIWLVSGDRDTATQTALWNEAVAKYGEDQAANWVAPPGHSNHEKGIAADLGGDLELAHQLAPRFGLNFPMSWEAWHIEPVDARTNPDAYTNPPLGFNAVSPNSDTSSVRPDLAQVISSMMGGPSYSDIFSVNSDPIMQAASALGQQQRPSLNPSRSSSPVFTTTTGGPDGIDAFMARLRAVESSGNYAAVNSESGANGAYQFMDTTWNGYGGYARAADAPPSVQDARARELMQTYYHQFGNWDDVAAAWYAGPAGNFQSGEVRGYVAKVRGA